MADGSSERKVKAGGLLRAFPGPLSSPSTDEPSVRMTLPSIITWSCCSRSDENREQDFVITFSIGILLSEELVVNLAPEKMKLVTDDANESINLWSSCESKKHQAVMDGQSHGTLKRTSKPRATVIYVSSR